MHGNQWPPVLQKPWTSPNAVSSFEMLCQTFTAVAARLWVSDSSFVFTNWKACSVVLITGDWLHHWRRSLFFALINSWFALLRKQQKSTALYNSEFILLHLSAVTSSISTSGSAALAVIHAHTIRLPPPYLTDDVVSWAVSLLRRAFLFASVHGFVFFFSPQNCVSSFKCFHCKV